MVLQRKLAQPVTSTVLAVLFIYIALSVMCCGLIPGTAAKAEERGDLTGRFEEPRTVTVDGKEYIENNKLTTILLMGVDKSEERSRNDRPGSFRSGGQADFLLLVVIDSKHETLTPIQIDRDTMAEITILGVLGNPAGTREGHICLAHSYGDGKEQSGMLTAEAVSRLFQGVKIDFFVAMNMDGIINFNEALGGVTVTLEDDFSALDPSMKPGETLTLRGKQSEYYVRTRMSIGVGTNEARMKRQDSYMSAARAIIDEKMRENANFIGNLFDAVSDYLTTDMRRGRMINEAYWSRNYERKGIITPPGEHTIGESGFMEFRPDEQELLRIVLDVFYEPAGTQ